MSVELLTVGHPQSPCKGILTTSLSLRDNDLCLSMINHSELIIDKVSVDCKQLLRPWECGVISILCSTSIIL